ncbi:MAG: hypothetical protein ABW043_16795 [Devosia sp.]|uniref:hypothetical protein n=1 Tax=Devosia sp. TaxID=1871048 RepID=UPI003390E4DD
MSEKKWLELRPRENGDFDELIARFSDGMVHVETMSARGVYIGFYCDDGRAHQLWISSDKKLRYHEAPANGEPPRFTAWGVERTPTPPRHSGD